MHTAKITKIGNSAGVILPKEVLAELNVGQGDRVFLVKEGDGYKIVPYDPEFEEQVAAAQKGARLLKNTLRQLAK